MIEHSALTTKVYEWLRDQILQHAFHPGDKLDIQYLADQLGVSRTPVKDAINRLAVEGLVVLQSRQGTYVATLTQETLRDLFEVRVMIESWAAEHLSADTLAENSARATDLFERCARLLDMPDGTRFDYNAFVALDTQLHSLIVNLTANAVLIEIYQRVITRAWIGRIYFEGGEEEFNRSQAAHNEHTAIVRAFANGDSAALAAALKTHAETSLAHTVSLLTRYPQPPAQEKRSRREIAPDDATR